MSSKNQTSHFRKAGVLLAAVVGVGVTACVLAPRAKADTYDKMTMLTFNEPVQVMNTVLQPGTYMFRLLDWNRHIIVITNQNRSHPYGIILATPAYRVFPTEKAMVTFWETPPGSVKAVRYWWYPGDYYGWEFQYPTQLKTVSAVSQTSAPQPAAPAPAPQAEAAPAPEPVTAPEPAPAPPQTAQNEQPQPEAQPPVEIAQNNPPPAPSATPETPAQPEQQPQQLPQTASPYPLIGLAGLFSMASYFGLRARVNR